MAKFLSGREPYFRVGIESATEDLTSFSVVGNSYFTGIVTANKFSGDGSLLSGIVASGVGITISDDNILVGTAFDLNFGQGIDVTPVSTGIVTIFSSYAPVAGISSYAEVAGVSTYASVAGIATYAEVAGVSTYAPISGIATYAEVAGIATYASVSGVSSYAVVSGISTYALISGISTYASTAGIASLAVGFGTTSSINTTGIITASKFFGDGSTLTGIATALDVIGDVNIAANQAASDGRALIYQNGEWIAGPVIGGVSYIPAGGEPYYNNTPILLDFEGATVAQAITNRGFNGPAFESYAGTSSVGVDNGPSGTNSLQSTVAGFDANIRTVSGSSLSLSGDFTIEWWAYITSANASAQRKFYVNLASGGTDLFGTFIRSNSGTYQIFVDGSNTLSTGTFPVDQWHHFACVRSSGTTRMYINGTASGNPSTNVNFNYPRHGFAGIVGSMANIRLTNGVARYTTNFTVPTLPLPQASSLPVSIPYSINNLDDVDTSTTAPVNGQSLIWNSSSSLWRPGTVSYASTAGIATYASSAGIASLAVGFGTTSSINTTGIITASRFVGDGSGLSSVIGISSQWVTNSAGIHTLSKVGIGTTNPLYNLHVNGEVVVSGGTSTTQHIKIKAYEQDGGALSFEGSSGQLLSISNNLVGDIFGVSDISGTPIILANSNGRVLLSPYNGNVGLGTTNPTSKLHVIGNGLFSGVVTATRYFGDGSQLTGISAGISTYAQLAGIATYASIAGIASYAHVAGIATYATKTGVSTYSLLAGISTIARTLDIDSSVFTSGIITASKFFGDGTGLTGIGVSVLDDINDVDIAAIQPASDGRALIYQNGEWVSGPVIGGYSYNTSDSYIDNVSLLMHMDGSNGSTTFIDSGANSGINTITVFGNAQISTAQSKFGGASAYFDGSGDYINIQDNPNFQFGTGDFTIECWFNATGLLVNYPTLLGNGNPSFSGSGSTGSWYLMVSGSPRKINVGTNTTNPIISSTTTINTGSWYHVALVRSGSSVYLFVNGALEAITTNTQSLNISNNGLRIGSNGWDGSQAFWYGYIDDVRVTKGIARYTSSFTLPTVAYPDPTDPNFNNVSLLLHMDGSNGSTTFTDSSSSALTVTPNGNVAISTAQSKFGGASAIFDGNGDYLAIQGSNFNFGSSNWTIEGWFYRNALGKVDAILRGDNGSSSGVGLDIYFSASNALTLAIDGSITTVVSVPQSTHGIAIQTWNHIAFTRSGNIWTIFVNGVDVGSATNSSTLSTPTNYRIGGNSFDLSYSWNGYIEEFRITKNVARYTSNFTPQNYPFPNSVGISTSLGYVINNLDDVDTSTTAPANGQSLIWDASNSVWKPSSVPYSSTAGVATYAQTAGIATNTIGGIVNVTNLNVSGITTLGVVGAAQINSVGVITALKFVGDGSLLTGVIPSSSTGINISDDDVNVGVALTINFGRNLKASQVSAGIVTVTTPSSIPTGISKETKSFVATSGQTVFSTIYNIGQIEVFMNGIRLSQSEYVATNGTSIILNEGAALNDLIEVVSNQILFVPFGDCGDFSPLASDAFGSIISPTFDALTDPGPSLVINDLGELS